MAEFVNRRIEDMLTELEQMKRIELYSKDEIKEISKKRTDFEYKIHRQTKCKEDYLSYIAYECILLKDIKLRRRATSMNEKKNDIEYALVNRVIKLYIEFVHRFPNDLELWLNYVLFCKTVNITRNVTNIFGEMLQIHGDKPRVWQLACRWEIEELNSLNTAKKLILKGLQRHPTCWELYIDALRIELKIASSITNKEKMDIQLKRIKIILKSGLKHISDTKFLIELCAIFNDFDCAQSIRSDLLLNLWENHSANKETWDFIAQCEREGKNVEEFDWVSLKEKFFLRNCPKKLENFFNVYETAVNKISPADACNSYIKHAVKLAAGTEYDPSITLQILKRALTKGHMLTQLTEQQYKIWLELLSCDTENTNEDEILKILEEACNNLPTSEFLWGERLKRCKSNPMQLVNIFKQAEIALPPEKGTLLWIILLENIKDLNQVKRLHEDSLRLSACVSKKLKPVFLKSFFNIGGIKIAREMYNSMIKIPPFEMDLHKTMMDLERKQVVPDYKQWKNCHEIATRQFGKTDPQVWLDFIEFEKELKHPQNCGPLYSRAMAVLDGGCIDQFITTYSLNKIKYAK